MRHGYCQGGGRMSTSATSCNWRNELPAIRLPQHRSSMQGQLRRRTYRPSAQLRCPAELVAGGLSPRNFGTRGNGDRSIGSVACRASKDKTQAEIDAEARAWKDYFGNCVKAPIGYKTYMIEDPALHKNAEDEGEGKWVKFTPEVGPVGERKPKPFAFKTVLKGPSRLVAVKLPRPMGITFEMDSQGFVRVVDLVSDSRAQQQSSVARLGAGPDNGSFAQVGDVLRAVTATTLEWGNRTELTGDLTGSERRVILFGTDGQSWTKVQGALRSGLVADGEVELVLERQELVRPGAAAVVEGAAAAGGWTTLTEEELERRAAADEERMLERAAAKVPGSLDEDSSFNLVAFGFAATTIGLFLAGFS